VRTTRAGQSALLLLDAVDVLAARKVPYAVIGAMAASVHGIVRASMDADAVLSLTIQETPSLERESSGPPAFRRRFVGAILMTPSRAFSV